VQQADVRVGALNDLAVEFEDEAQHTVGGRVLRAKVDREVLHLLLALAGDDCDESTQL